MTIHALILAGGHGSRLGLVRKADIRLGGRTLLERAKDHLRNVPKPALVSVGGSSDGLRDLDLSIGGPLAGVVAAANYLRDEDPAGLLITVAVDTPFLPEDFVRRLVAALDGGASAAQAGWRGNFYPTNALWRLSALSDLAHLAQAGSLPKSLKTLLARASAVSVDWADTHERDPFANLNTPDDLVELARRAGNDR